MTKEELFDRSEYWRLRLIKNNFPISDNISQFKLGWSTKNGGMCIRHNKQFRILFSKYILKFDDVDIDEIIVHELLHTIRGCFNHKNKWLVYAHKANEVFSLNVTQYMRDGLHLIDKEQAKKNYRPFKYFIKCENCNRVFGYKILSKPYKSILSNEKMYWCGKCGSYELVKVSRDEYVDWMKRNPL